jgi:hypothetical protein
MVVPIPSLCLATAFVGGLDVAGVAFEVECCLPPKAFLSVRDVEGSLIVGAA